MPPLSPAQAVEAFHLAFLEILRKRLASPALAITLRGAGLAVVVEDVTKPKQTDTTRRWKIPVARAGQRNPVRTKIEFSNRNGDSRHELEAVPERVVRPYGLRPPPVRHYLVEPATEQKVRALDPEVAELYDDTAWDQMRFAVADRLLDEA